jgi:hypothetical protein
MPYTKTQVDDMLDRNLNPFRQDVVDGTHTVGSPQAIVANTPVRFSVDVSVIAHMDPHISLTDGIP